MLLQIILNVDEMGQVLNMSVDEMGLDELGLDEMGISVQTKWEFHFRQNGIRQNGNKP